MLNSNLYLHCPPVYQWQIVPTFLASWYEPTPSTPSANPCMLVLVVCTTFFPVVGEERERRGNHWIAKVKLHWPVSDFSAAWYQGLKKYSCMEQSQKHSEGGEFIHEVVVPSYTQVCKVVKLMKAAEIGESPDIQADFFHSLTPTYCGSYS